MNTPTPAQKRNQKLAQRVVAALKARHFDACACATSQEAVAQALRWIPQGASVSWGGSVTLAETGLLEAVKKAGLNVLDRETAATPQERQELMRRALLCDVFLSGVNAVSMDGQLVNVDGNGNRLAAWLYGPKMLIVLAGINKIVPTERDAMTRARTHAAPINVQRFEGLDTPCAHMGACTDCTSKDSICAQLLTTRLSRPAGRIKVIIIEEELGF